MTKDDDADNDDDDDDIEKDSEKRINTMLKMKHNKSANREQTNDVIVIVHGRKVTVELYSNFLFPFILPSTFSSNNLAWAAVMYVLYTFPVTPCKCMGMCSTLDLLTLSVRWE